MHCRRFVLASLLLIVVGPSTARPLADDDNRYQVTVLVSNVVGDAPVVDPKLQNAWGIAANATSPWWVANNGSDSSTLYSGAGVKFPPPPAAPLEVAVAGAPTGIVAYPVTGTQFKLSTGLSARFIFATESGTVQAWRSGTAAEVVFTGPGSIFKGLAIHGDTLYTTDFAECKVETLNGIFKPFDSAGGFEDDSIPADYCPFGIQAIDDSVFVTYALRGGLDDVAGVSHGFVRQFDTDGNLVAKVASHGTLNSPWGLALAPEDFGKFSGCLLVGNFGDGLINAYCLDKQGEFRPRGRLQDGAGNIKIDGLWGIGFGNGQAAGPTNVLYFAAGPDDEKNGRFGKIEVAQ
jgi:uncharacterized protein (TIGR03118 family)